MKLFRNLRQSLIKEGNLKRYLLYAVGEILLVMIGISLAFQVDNWNEDRIKRKAEIQYYKNIRAQIQDDKALIQGEMLYNNLHRDQFNYANEIIEANKTDELDTLGLIAINLTNYSDFDRQGNIYETMVNSGEIKLLRNDNIINRIRELEEIYMYVNRMENIHYDAMIRYAAPAVTSTIKWSTGKVQQPDKLYSYEFQNLIIVLLDVIDEKDGSYSQALSKIEELTILLNEELANK